MSARSPLPCLLAALTLVAFAAPTRAEVAEPAAASPAEAATPTTLDEAPTSGGVAPLALPALTPASAPPRVLVAAPVVEKPKRVPLAKRWWFWAGLGTAAVGVVLAAIFLGPRPPYTGNAMPGQESVF